MSATSLKEALLSSLESELTGTLEDIDRRLREAKILIEGVDVDVLNKICYFKIDVLRELRPDSLKKEFDKEGTAKFLEKLLEGVKGHVIITESHRKTGVSEGGWKAGDYSIRMDFTVIHSYYLKDGKYVCDFDAHGHPNMDIGKLLFGSNIAMPPVIPPGERYAKRVSGNTLAYAIR